MALISLGNIAFLILLLGFGWLCCFFYLIQMDAVCSENPKSVTTCFCLLLWDCIDTVNDPNKLKATDI